MNDNQKALTFLYNATASVKESREFHMNIAMAYQRLMTALETAQEAPASPKQTDEGMPTMAEKE